MHKKIHLLLLITSVAFSARGQTNLTLDRNFLLPCQSDFNNIGCTLFKALSYDSSAGYKDFIFKNKNHLLSAGTLNATIFPLAGASGGYDVYGKKGTYDYSGGLHIDGKWGSKFSFSGNYLGGDVYGPSFMDSIIKRYKVVPGMGYAYGSAAAGYSYQYWDGYISYTLNNNFNFQIGKGKQFWGDGYRSLFLSDVSNSYPYFKITATIWKMQYISMFTIMQDAETSSGLVQNFYTKYSSFLYLSWNDSQRCNFSIF